MKKEFILQLQTGLKTKDILKSNRELFNKLVELNAIITRDNTVRLSFKFKLGKLDISRQGLGFVDIFGDDGKDVLIESNKLNNALKGDIVLIKIDSYKRRKPMAAILLIVQKEFAQSVVYLTKKGDKIIANNIKTDLNVHLDVKQKALKQLPLNCVLKINNYTSEIIEVLGVLDDPLIDEKISLALFNKEEAFSKQSSIEAISFGTIVDKSLYPQRVDLTNLTFCTIDPNSAKDFDDAIYFDIQKNILYVAIADVSEYVNPYSSIDNDAINRGFSIYFPHKSIPMLPRELSENLCSLKPDVDRLAFVYKIEFDDNLNIINESFFDAIINSKRRFTYDEIDLYLDSNNNFIKPIDKTILNWLLPLYKKTTSIRTNRFKTGYDFKSEDISMILKDNLLLKTEVEYSTKSHELIEECMLLANKGAAKMIDYGIFRNHLEPSFDKINELYNNLYVLNININPKNSLHSNIIEAQVQADMLDIRHEVDTMIIKAQKRAEYSPVSSGHFGLGFDEYTHFTSPIRRYSDLILHRVLKSKISNEIKKQQYILSKIEATCVTLSTQERESAKVAWDFMDRKYARWAKDNLEKVFDAIITDTTGSMMIAKLYSDDVQNVRVFMNPKSVQLYEKVKVKIIDSNIATTKIKVKLV